MPSKSFAIGTVIFGLIWGTFFYPPGPKPAKAALLAQQSAPSR